jgi:hypothetical protein
MTHDPSRIDGARTKPCIRCVNGLARWVRCHRGGRCSATRWLARNVRHVCDGAVPRSGRYRDTVRSERTSPSFSNSPWIRGAPQRWFSVAIRRMRARRSASMHGLPVAAATDGPTSPQPFPMPAGDRGRLHQHQRVLPPRPPPSQAHPEQSVRWAKASIRTTKDRQLMAQCKTLNEEVSTHRQGDPKRHDRATGGTHGL